MNWESGRAKKKEKTGLSLPKKENKKHLYIKHKKIVGREKPLVIHYSIRQHLHASAYVSIPHHTSAYISKNVVGREKPLAVHYSIRKYLRMHNSIYNIYAVIYK